MRGTSIYAQIQKVAAMAFTIAKEHNRAKPGIEDIMEATQEVLPSAPAESPFPSPAAPPQAAKRVPSKKAIHEEIFPGRRPNLPPPIHNRAIKPAHSPKLDPVA